MKTYVADFETTTREEDCRVWAYAICDVDNIESVVYGTTIDDFMEWCSKQKDNPKILFHNLKFDGQFILHWLFLNGFKHGTTPKERVDKSFSTMISDKGLYYSIEVIFYRKNKKIRKVTFQDSLKLIPLSVDQIAKSFHMDKQKLEIDYKAHDLLPIGSPLTLEEKLYIKHDVQIVATAMNYFYSQGLDKMTIGSCALSEYKKIITKKRFEKYFPIPEYDADVRQSYRGGFTYLNPKFSSKTIADGIVLDVNSLYPSVMRYEYLPFGTPIFYEGKYEDDPLYCLYVQMFRCEFEIKPNKIPTIQLKNSMFFKGNEYITSSNNQEIVLCLTSVDLELFFEQYNVYNIEWLSGWKFKATKGLFNEYIDKWSNNKIQAKKEKNHGLYLISKLFLNSLYGKFSTGTTIRSKIPYFDEDSNEVKYYDSEPKSKDGIYIAIGSFITSYARRKTITSSQKIMDNNLAGISKAQWVYSDTDSMHISLNGESPEKFLSESGLDISDTELGAWKYESRFRKAKFLRQKCYIEDSTEDVENSNPDYELKVTVAGMPNGCHSQVTFKNFKIGASYTGKLQPKIVDGGCILKEVDFTINPL